MIFKKAVSPERQAFEAWMQQTHTTLSLVRMGKGYINETVRVAWRAWQASRQHPRSAP